MGTNCAPLVDDLFLFCYERNFMLSLSDGNQSDVIYVISILFLGICQIPRPHFGIYIYLYWMVLLSLKFKMHEMILIRYCEFSFFRW